MSTALGGFLVIQIDGSGVFTRINGTTLALAPEMVRSPVSDLNASNWVQDGANHYQYRIANYYQGLAATAP